MQRRQIITTAASVAVYTGLTGGIRVARSSETQDLRVIVKNQGAAFEYTMRNSRSMGAFTSEIGGFTQEMHRAVHEKFPLVVNFRPDRDSDRIEIVFELGDLWSSQPKHLGPYSVEIFAGGNQLAATDVPKHFWFSRWRWQSKPRPVVGDSADLIARGLLPPLQRAGGSPRNSSVSAAPSTAPAKGLPGNSQFTEKGMAIGLGAGPAKKANEAVSTQYAIMELAGLTASMGTTGERPDIGMVTGHQADYICTGSSVALATTRNQAEAGGTVPWHLRDPKTGAPVDLDAYPTMSWYERPVGSPQIVTTQSDVIIDSAHQPALAYVAYMLTGDPYHLEDMQFAANWNRGCLPPTHRLSISQPRALAWSIRTLAQCAKVTPVSVPQWLLPQNYWVRDLERMRNWFTETFVRSKDPLRTLFRTVDNITGRRDEGSSAPEGTYFAPWEEEFIASVFGWLVIMGFEDWRPCFDWKIGSTIARTDGKSGWGRSYSTPYRLLVKRSNQAPVAASWAEAWAITSAARNFKVADPNAYEDSDPAACIFTRGALAIAAQLKTPGAAECFTWIDREAKRRGFAIPNKWNIVPT